MEGPAKDELRVGPGGGGERFKQQVNEQGGFKGIRLVDDLVGEMPDRAGACRHTYRLIVVRKNLEVSEPPQQHLFDDYRYFFYLTNDDDSTPEEIVFTANDRCQQENVLAQLKSVRALHAPVDNLLSNNAYMLITSLAWNLKAWLALSLAESWGGAKAARALHRRRICT